MKRISERSIAKQFLKNLNENYCGDNSQGNHLKTQNGIVSKDELYNHFDLNNDGTVTGEDYANHIEHHCKYPESLDYYKEYQQNSHVSVPCINSYDSCSRHLMQNPDDIDVYIKPLMDVTGSTCIESSVKSLLDVLQSLINCGVFK